MILFEWKLKQNQIDAGIFFKWKRNTITPVSNRGYIHVSSDSDRCHWTERRKQISRFEEMIV